MDLSVIIVCYKGWESLRKCLDSLSRFTGDTISFEVIVVDNNSGDGMADKFEKEYPHIRFVRSEKNGGFAYGCNLGESVSKGAFLLFLNPDTVISDQSVKGLLDYAARNPEVFITSCRQVNENGRESRAFGLFPGFMTLTGAGRSVLKLFKPSAFSIDTAKEALSPDWVSGSVMMMRKEIFHKIGGFDEDFWMYYEDTDICRRARNMGGEIVCLTGITVRHDHGGSSRIDPETTSITKTEVLISRHLYISKHTMHVIRPYLQLWLVAVTLLSSLLNGAIGLILFFIPGLFVSFHIFRRLLIYYQGALERRSWISCRSVNGS